MAGLDPWAFSPRACLVGIHVFVRGASVDDRAKPGHDAAMKNALGSALDRLWRVIEARRGADPENSYTARLLAEGRGKIAQKLGEEAIEAVIEAVKGDPAALTRESADILYHLLVLWADAGISPADVAAELTRREGVSGLDEKRGRQGG
jgi:phosphoribosyl-ATP pyrophosphohydrolase